MDKHRQQHGHQAEEQVKGLQAGEAIHGGQARNQDRLMKYHSRLN